MKGKVNSEGITTLEFTWEELTRLQVLLMGKSDKEGCGDLKTWDAVLEACWTQARKINKEKNNVN